MKLPTAAIIMFSVFLVFISPLLLAAVSDEKKDGKVIARVGGKVSLFNSRSSRENSSNFLAYRAQKGEQYLFVIDHMDLQSKSKCGKCLNESRHICQRKEFCVHNQTHLAMEIYNVTGEDGGNYTFQHYFTGIEKSDHDSVTLQVEEKPVLPSSPISTWLETPETTSSMPHGSPTSKAALCGGNYNQLIIIIFVTTGAETRAFTSRPSNPKECVTGNNISLAWNFTLLPNDSVMEIFFGVYSRYMSKKILAIKPNGSVAVRNSYKRRVFWKGDVTLRTVVVWMYNLTEQDENTYGIFIELGLDKIPLIAAVRVIVQDYPYVSNMTSNKTIQEGDEFLLFCHAKGKPLPQTQLIKVNGTTESKAAMGYTELSIPYARRNDQGWYRCVVTNKVGQDDEFVFVNVQSRIPPSNVAATSQLPSPVFAMIIGVSSISGIAVVILTVHIAKKYGTNLWLYKGRYSQLVV